MGEIASCRVQGSLTGERADWKLLSLRKKKSDSPPDAFLAWPLGTEVPAGGFSHRSGSGAKASELTILP